MDHQPLPPKNYSPSRSNGHEGNAAKPRSRRPGAAIVNDRQFRIAALAVIGVLIALYLIFRFPDFGAIIAQHNQF
jgi:hypothetical protein